MRDLDRTKPMANKASGITPAMAAGVTDTLWEIEDIARLSD